MHSELNDNQFEKHDLRCVTLSSGEPHEQRPRHHGSYPRVRNMFEEALECRQVVGFPTILIRCEAYVRQRSRGPGCSGPPLWRRYIEMSGHLIVQWSEEYWPVLFEELVRSHGRKTGEVKRRKLGDPSQERFIYIPE